MWKQQASRSVLPTALLYQDGLQGPTSEPAESQVPSCRDGHVYLAALTYVARLLQQAMSGAASIVSVHAYQGLPRGMRADHSQF